MTKFAGDDELIAKICGLAEAELASGQPYLLAKLGQDLGAAIKPLKDRKGSLAGFISDNLSDRYVVAKVGRFGNIQGIVRASGSAVDDEATVATLASVTQTGEKRSARFNYKFWAAFSVPDNGKKRFLNLSDFNFVEPENSEVPTGDFVVIEPEFIALDRVENRNEIIASNIRGWLKKHGLSEDRFYAVAKQRDRGSSGFVKGISLLDVLVDTLDHREMARTVLPLDVVAKLMKKMV